MDNKRLSHLLDRFFSYTCSPSEKEELMRLLDSGEYDAEVKSYIDQAWDKEIPAYQLTDTQSESILSAILPGNTAVKVIPRIAPYTKWYWPAAAVLLVALSFTAYYLLNGVSRQQPATGMAGKQPAPRANDIAPGTNGALLTLADGTVIVLDSTMEGNLADQGGTRVMKKGGTVQYVAGAGGPNAATAFNSIGTPRGRQFQLVLEDGTKVWLNAESSIRFPTVFDKSTRKVDITGEAYFEVAKSAGRPFTVAVNGIQVQVLGTHFNINAYQDEGAIQTTLLEGSVNVVNNGNAQRLLPGQQARISETGDLTVLEHVNTQEIVAWKDDLFLLDNTDIKTLMRQLSRWYDAEIVLPSQVAPVRFNGTISRKSNISEVLKMLELTGEVSFSVEGRKVTVKM